MDILIILIILTPVNDLNDINGYLSVPIPNIKITPPVQGVLNVKAVLSIVRRAICPGEVAFAVLLPCSVPAGNAALCLAKVLL